MRSTPGRAHPDQLRNQCVRHATALLRIEQQRFGEWSAPRSGIGFRTLVASRDGEFASAREESAGPSNGNVSLADSRLKKVRKVLLENAPRRSLRNHFFAPRISSITLSGSDTKTFLPIPYFNEVFSARSDRRNSST